MASRVEVKVKVQVKVKVKAQRESAREGKRRLKSFIQYELKPPTYWYHALVYTPRNDSMLFFLNACNAAIPMLMHRDSLSFFIELIMHADIMPPYHTSRDASEVRQPWA